MTTLQEFDLSPTNLERAKVFWMRHANHPMVQSRRDGNVETAARRPSASLFWKKLVMGFLTSQQNSSQGSPVNRFLDEPFALELAVCRARHDDLATFVTDELKAHGGIRFAKKLGGVISAAFRVLDSMVSQDDIAGELASELTPLLKAAHDATSERKAARFLARAFSGIGPKQSRNVLQALGLTRYEVPIDSRLTKWLASYQIFAAKKHALGRTRYYDHVSREFQRMCSQIDVLPCLMDAAVFASLEPTPREELRMGARVLLAPDICDLLEVERATELILRSSNDEYGVVETPSGLRAVVPLSRLVPLTWGLEPR